MQEMSGRSAGTVVFGHRNDDARNSAFYNRNGCLWARRCQTAVAVAAYGRLWSTGRLRSPHRRGWSPMLGLARTVMVLHRFAALCYGEMHLQIDRRHVWRDQGGGLQIAALCHTGMQLHIASIATGHAMVGSRWHWVADGGAVSLGNALAHC